MQTKAAAAFQNPVGKKKKKKALKESSASL